jgi:hypothetical protein
MAFDTKVLVIIVVLFALALALAGVCASYASSARDEFIRECQAAHHPHFECVERWRASEPASTTVYSTPVVMPVSR